MLGFFAPRDLDGTPVDPYIFLAEDDEPDEETARLTADSLSGVPLFDFCRISHSNPNRVNVLVVADVIFHWDTNDSYVIPTTQFNWHRDLEEILKDYPKSSEVHVYTNWETDKLIELNVKLHPLHDLPLEHSTWLNMPTMQELWGLPVLIGSLAISACIFGLIYLKQQEINALSEKIQIAQQQIPREGKFLDLARVIRDQEKQMKYRATFPWLVKDVAQSIQVADMKIANFEVKNHRPQDPPNVLIATVEAEKDVYKGWLQEEPVAKKLLLSSSTMRAIRKPPGNIFKLEGMIDLAPVYKEYQAIIAKGVKGETGKEGDKDS